MEDFVEDVEARYDQTDSPPVPVAVGSPAWAKKSFETGTNRCVLVPLCEYAMGILHTVEEGVQIKVIDLA